MRDVDELAYRYLAVQHEPGDAGKRSQEDFGDDDDVDDLAQEGMLDFVVAELARVFGGVRVEKEDVAVEVLDPERNLPMDDDGNRDDNGLVDDIDHEVGRELREELGEPEVVVDGDRERCGNAFAEVVAVEEVGEDRTETATQQCEYEYGDADLVCAAEESPLLEHGGGDADKDADDAVIERGEVGNAVERVGAEPDDYGGESAAYHGGEDGADGVGENRKLEIEGQFRGDDIDEERGKDETEGPQNLP